MQAPGGDWEGRVNIDASELGEALRMIYVRLGWAVLWLFNIAMYLGIIALHGAGVL